MLSRFDPFAELSRLSDEFRNSRGDRRGFNFQPAVDIYEDKESIVVKAELPGVKAEDVNVNVEKNVLTISGERKLHKEDNKDGYHRIETAYGTFTRSFSLPSTLDSDTIDARLEEGILTLKLRKKAQAQPKRIEVKAPAKA